MMATSGPEADRLVVTVGPVATCEDRVRAATMCFLYEWIGAGSGGLYLSRGVPGPERKAGCRPSATGAPWAGGTPPTTDSSAGSRAWGSILLSLTDRRFNLKAPLEQGDHDAEEHALLTEHIVAYCADAQPFFAATHRFLLEPSEVAVVIPRMSRVTAMDATGALLLKDAVAKLNRRGIAVLISEIRPDQCQVLGGVGALALLCEEGRAHPSTPEAIQGGRDHRETVGLLPVISARSIRTIDEEPTR
jgi:hypothetical protein